MTKLATLFAFSLAIGLGFVAGAAEAVAPETLFVNCPVDSIQEEVNEADGPTTIFVTGICVQNVSITKDDITLSGNQAGNACIKTNPGGTGTIDGTVTVDGVRAKIEFLEITGPGGGVVVTNRADAELFCNDISTNDGTGVFVSRTSNAVLRDNFVENNGQEDLPPTTDPEDPTAHFHCGLVVEDASSVASRGNTYRGNSFCAIESDRQSSFRSGEPSSPRRAGVPVDPTARDVILERGCTPLDLSGCARGTDDTDVLAIDIFNGGNVDLRNTQVTGEISNFGLSAFRMDDAGELVGNIFSDSLSIVRIRNRNINTMGEGRVVRFTGMLSCNSGAITFSTSDVQCGQTCSGAIPSSCGP